MAAISFPRAAPQSNEVSFWFIGDSVGIPYELKRRVLSERGHLCNEDCGNAIVEIMKNNSFKNIILGHLSNTNNVPELAHKSVSNILNAKGIVLDKDLKLTVAQRNNPSNFIRI